MTLNKQVFQRDPTAYSLPNDGVAKVAEPRTAAEWEVARYEVEQFVCEGSYREGLRRILESFLANLDQPTQRAVWVHGFYGCGKSQLVRMLDFLWRDVRFPDGATARGLAHLPDDILDALRELSNVGRQRGGLWSAAGTLSAGSPSDPRSALLGIVLRSAGLPERIALAQFDLWVRKEGWRDQLRAGLAAQGRNYTAELHNLFMSTALARELLKVDPGLGSSADKVLSQIRSQFPEGITVTTELMVDMMQQVFAMQSHKPGRLPCVLIVVDELQQYLGESVEKADVVQEAVEAAVSRFESNVLFVATGQSALVANSILQKLQARFTIHVALEDKDTEEVLRQTVLRKKPSAESELGSVLERARGEIDRHLGGTRVGPESSDGQFLVADYPLLPTRRRFWQKVLRGLDQSGTAARLRTQLRLAHEAAREVSDEPLGTVVAGDFIFAQQRPTLLQTASLSREFDERISELQDGTEDGKLASRVCALLFLISKVDRSLGIKATADALADLLVTNLRTGSAALREKVPALLRTLTEQGAIMQVGDEYRLQTPEGSEWERDYRNRLGAVKSDDARIGAQRHQLLQETLLKTFRISLTQGESKTPRSFEFSFGSECSPVETKVPIWVQTGWDVTEAAVQRAAVEAGQESPVVFVFLPKLEAEKLRQQVAGYIAAQEVLATRAAPTTDDGRAAKSNIQARFDAHKDEISAIVEKVLASAKVFLGGGTKIDGPDLNEVLGKACQDALLRLYPRFPEADYTTWNRVSDRARQGDPDPLGAVNYRGDAAQQPVCKEVLAYVGVSGKQGNEVRRHFAAPPYGWPREAVDGALLALTAAGYLRVTYRNQPSRVSELTGTTIQQAEFRAEQRIITFTERAEIRKLLQEFQVQYRAGEEAEAVLRLLNRMQNLAEAAGGAPPLPEKPRTYYLKNIMELAGNERLGAAYEQRATLAKDYREWDQASRKAQERLPRWELLQALVQHARRLPVYQDVATEMAAIVERRSLLAEPDPLPPLLSCVGAALRAAVKEARDKHLYAYEDKISDLLESKEWKALTPEKQQEIRERRGLGPLPVLKVDTDEDLLKELDRTPLPAWEDKTAAMAERVAQALLDAAREGKPTALRLNLKRATIRSEAELEAYLAEVKADALAIIKSGRPVVLP
ncbi:MAG TPA: BREX system P-loop protein BrxC [Firmicutes bacterium]|nr:BREX system P-loop protein BrxC [Bacillota bacterium]